MLKGIVWEGHRLAAATSVVFRTKCLGWSSFCESMWIKLGLCLPRTKEMLSSRFCLNPPGQVPVQQVGLDQEAGMGRRLNEGQGIQAQEMESNLLSPFLLGKKVAHILYLDSERSLSE
ncbi:hypothetical protein Ddye_003789 [Dipteronia dyeriana]|uniref:Uncharacterized protein n=1 Tax=Dipteronia dyeriana TaxID=168575 RepID=A0AAE0CVN7_9ROSI|nr:hypothetical protein Ddye_003789 [Dipteronia dyeriana]